MIDFDPALRLGDLFAAAAARHPEAVALRHEGGDIDYRALSAQVGRVARALHARGIGPGNRVGVCASRGPGMFQSLLGVLVSGAAFVPLDPGMPAERLREVCEDAELSAVVGPAADLAAAASLPDALPRVDVETVAGASEAEDAPLQVLGSASDPAYVIFTSGSTGRPKGAVNAHRGVVNRLLWGQLDWPIGPGDRVVQKTPFTFDVSVWEYLWPLTTGATLVIARPGGHRDPAYIASLIQREGITLAHFVPSMLRLFLHEPAAAHCRSLRRVMCSGEALPADTVHRFHEILPGVRLSNLYGPTEAAIEVTRWECDPALERNPVPIGAPVANTRIYVLDPQGRRVAAGQQGEIVIAGVQVGLGYFRRPDLSDAVFKDDPFHPGERMYHTGDLGRWTEDGVVECLGRIDHQVKIRGNRIELGEIEARLRRHPQVRDCVASAMADPLGESRLVVHVVPVDGEAPTLSGVHAFLRDQLPDYMLPDALVALDALPLLSSGKTDRRALPPPSFPAPPVGAAARAPGPGQADSIGSVWRELLGQPDLPESANLFDSGARSVTVLAFLSRMREAGVATITVGDIYDHPTIAALEQIHRGSRTAEGPRRRASGGPVAIVGMAVRAPGAGDVDAFWDMLCAGREGIRRFEAGELDPEVPEQLRGRSDFVPAKGIVDDADRFDAALFGIPPREATLTDPQQRILVEMALHALEHAGIDPARCPDIGVFVGTANNTYVAQLRQHAPQLVAQSGEFATMVGNDKDFVATRIAHRLDLKGPAISVHTACSTGLVTVTQAVQALRSGQCEVALAGGATIIVPQRTGHLHIEGGMESADGHCRPFSADATGTVFSSGAALVVLRRLEDALAAGDTVYAVIEGIGVNNDGGHKASFTAPSVEGQSDAIRRALRDAGADPGDIGFVEAHGTGTPLGDPIEVSGLARAWDGRDPGAERCVLGSVKANVGHTIAAAGVLGLVRCALSLHHELIPGTPHFDAPNPHIDFDSSPFTVLRDPRPWLRGPRRRLAAVSSFGVGGTNAHVVLAEAPRVPGREVRREPLSTPTWVPVSGADRDAVLRNAKALAAHLEAHPTLALSDVASTLAGRTGRAYRAVATGRDVAEAAAALGAISDARRALDAPRVVFLFPGQGSQHPGMAAGLREALPAFATAFDAVMDVVGRHVEVDLARLLLDPEPDEDAAAVLAQTRHAQPALFAMSYALASWLRSLGVEPVAMIGHSIGEYAAAAVSGMIDMESAAGCVCARGAAMQAQPPGAMLAVRAPRAEVEAWLDDTVEVAAGNAPSLTVLAGPTEGIDAIAAQLAARDVPSTRLRVSHAFHSRSMEGALPAVEAAWRAVGTFEPGIPFYSCVSGAPIRPDEARDPAYWARQVRQPVRFSDALSSELDAPDTVFVEVGPSQALTALVRAHRRSDGSMAHCVPLLPSASGGVDAAQHVMQAVGTLWTLGVAVAPSLPESARRIALPGYAFADTRFWYPRPERGSAGMPDPALAAGSSRPAPAADPTTATVSDTATGSVATDRRALIEAELRQVLAGVAGLAPGDIDARSSLLEQGLDSLSLTQAALEISRVFDCRVALRELLGPLDSLSTLVDHLDAAVAPERFRPAAADPQSDPIPGVIQEHATGPKDTLTGAGPAEAAGAHAPPAATHVEVARVLEQQMALMTQQLQLLRAWQGSLAAAVPLAANPSGNAAQAAPQASDAHAGLPDDGAPGAPPDGRQSGPLGPGQMERWMAANFDDRGMLALNETLRLDLAGDLDVAAFEDAAREVFDRHAAFRLGFDSEHPRQQVHGTATLQLERVDLDRRPDLLGALESLCDEYANTCFDMARPPLARAVLVRVRPGHHVFLLVVSHLIFDGWSSSVLVRELAQAYRARLQRQPSGLPAPDSPLAFAIAERERFEGASGQADLDWWCQALADVPAPPRLGDIEPSAERSFACGTLRHEFDAATLEALRRRATQGKATLFHLLLACLATQIAQETGNPRVVVGVPYPGQAVAGRHDLIGDGALDLPVLLELAPGKGSLDEALGRARDVMIGALEHPNITQGTLARALGLKAHGDRPPISGVFFNLNPRVPLTGFGPLVASVCEATKPGLLSEAFFNFYELGNTLLLELHYSRDFFSEARAQQVLQALVRRISSLDDAVDGPLAHAPAGPDATEPARFGPELAFDRSLRVDQYLCPVMRGTTEALVFHGTSFAGVDLDEAANRLARTLRAQGVGRGKRVGLCLERGPTMLVAVLAVLKSGAAYVPLDPAYPDARLQVIAEDAAFDLVLAPHDATLGWLANVARLDPDAGIATTADASPLKPDPGHDAGAEDPAYVIFTSGSTGRPKGVVVPHRAVVNFLASMAMEPGLGVHDRLVAVTTLCFDIAILELMLPLATGATLVLADRDQAADSEALIELLDGARATIMQATPSTWRMVLETGWKGRPGFKALVGGEALPPTLARAMLDLGLEPWNMYGPTETTVWSSLWRVRDPDAIRVGRPIANTSIHVLDPGLHPCACGAVGEIFIGGEGVALGYLGREELTRERFLAMPGGRLYRTGDLGRWDADDQLEHLGRADFQLKVRGHRIEPGEIEQCIACHPDVGQAVVVAREMAPGDTRLVAYVTARPSRTPDPASVRQHIVDALPQYMVPQHVVVLPGLPLTPNGKVDRNALPCPLTVVAHTRAVASEEDPRVALVLELVREVLGDPGIQADDNFFESGGHSLLALSLAARVKARTGTRPNLLRLANSSLRTVAMELPSPGQATDPGRRPGLGRRLLRLIGGGQTEQGR